MRIGQLCPLYRHVPRVIPWGGILLVARSMFFVNNDKAKARQRRKNSRASTYNHIGLASLYFLPLHVALGGG
jgi:hypothetical protein